MVDNTDLPRLLDDEDARRVGGRGRDIDRLCCRGHVDELGVRVSRRGEREGRSERGETSLNRSRAAFASG